MAKKKITVQGNEISLISSSDSEDYISLTDIMKGFDDEFAIYSWMRNRNTVEFLGVWEQLHNDDFKGNEFVRFKEQAGLNNFNLTPKKWIDATGAVGIISKSGRYGGTYAHQDIAVNFCYWLSPAFQLYLIREFQRLKEEESKQLDTEWNLKRLMSRANHRVHTEAIRQHLIPGRLHYSKVEGKYFASEVDLVNLALFGKTAREWRLINPKKKGNMRDYATSEQLLVLSNLQSLNAKLLEWNCDQEQRFDILNKTAIEQMEILLNNPALKSLSTKPDQPKKLK